MDEERLRVFISSYACEPNLGSEIGVGWHWVLEMSKYFDLWVLTRKSNQKNIEDWFNINTTGNEIHFLYYDLPKYLRFWKKGLRGVRTYYILWQKLTNHMVREAMEKNNIEIFHLLTYGNALWPISKYGQRQFFVWGPVGVGDIIPSDFCKHYRFKDRIIEWLRRKARKTLSINMGFNKRCERANLIFCKTDTAIEQIPNKYREKALLFTDVAVEKPDIQKYLKTFSSSLVTRFLAVGRLEGWRGFDLLIEAFAIAVKKDSGIQLEILGEGADRIRLEELIKKHKISTFVTLSGHVSMGQYYQKMADCDVVVNPCLKEGAVTTAFDSMAFGKPLICINTGGYTHHFRDTYSIVIQRTTREEVINQLADAILRLTDNETRRTMGKMSREEGEKYTWEHKGKKVYQEIVKRYMEWSR